MEGLPAELTIDILSRLPVKTIVHCKCVCKKWKNLVSDSSFVNLHISKSPTTGLMINLKDTSDRCNVLKDLGILKWVEIEDKVDHHRLHHRPFMTLHLNLAFNHYHIDQVGSVNDLICLWQYSPKLDNTYICNPKLDNTYICNPVTREIMILPRSRYYKQSYAVICYGFGVNSVTGEYKVVRIFQDDEKLPRPSVLEAEVYTLGTCQWRSLGRVPYWLNGLYGPFLNNHCHWIVCDEEDVPEKICTFDFDTETFQLFPSPPPEYVQENQFHHQSLAVVKGSLCKLDSDDSEFTIWVMKEYGIKKSWHKEVVIKKGVSSFHITWLIRKPMYLIEGLEDGSILIVSYNNKLLAYCPKSGTIKDTKIKDGCKSVLTYRPSFLKLQNFELERVQMF